MRVLLAASIVLLATPTLAADAVDYIMTPPPSPAAVSHDWNGFYAGISGGLGGGSKSVDFQNNGFEATASTVPFLLTDTPTTWYSFSDCFISGVGFWGGFWDYCGEAGKAFGGFFGGQVGYNWQRGDLVFGVEADAFISNIESSGSASWEYDYGGGNFGSTDTTLSTELEAFGTVRGRIGQAMDRFLPYATAGVAWGHVTTSVASENFNTFSADKFIAPTSSGEFRWGWTVGAGVEYAINDKLSFKTEYLYIDLGDSTANFEYTVDGGPLIIRSNNRYHTLKAGLNYGF